MKVFIGARVLQLPTGGYTRLFTKDDEAAAKQAIQQADMDFRVLSQAQLVQVGPDGKARPLGMSFGQAIEALGVHAVGHGVDAVEVEGVIQAAPRGRILMPD